MIRDGLTLEVVVGDGWSPVADEDGLRWAHPSGLELSVRERDGARGKLEVTVHPADVVATADAPRLSIDGTHPLVPWLGGASAEVVMPTPDGPVLATQQRGYCVGESASASLFPEPLVVAPGHALTSVWTVERLGHDLLDLPGEPAWLPPRRHLPAGDEIQLAIPDGVVIGVEHTELDDGFVLLDDPGLHTAEVGGPRGVSRVEVGWHADWEDLLAAACEAAPDDLWCFLTQQRREPDLEGLERRLPAAMETPTLWSALAASHAVVHGLATDDDARELAARVVDGADVPTRVALLTRGLVDVGCLVGVQLGRVAYDGLLRFGLGRIMTPYPDGAERELVPAWFWVAGMGESPLGARIGGIAGLAQARALCRASETHDPEAVAWLSLFA